MNGEVSTNVHRETPINMNRETSTAEPLTGDNPTLSIGNAEFVTFDASQTTQMKAYSPETTLHVTFRLLAGTALGRIIDPLQQLTTAYDFDFRELVYALLQMSMEMLTFLTLESLRAGLDFGAAEPAVSALLCIFAASVPNLGRLAPYVRQFLYACFELFIDFAEAIGRRIPEGAKTASRGFFVQTVPDLYNRSFAMAGSFGRQAGQTAVAVIVVPAQYMVNLLSTVIQGVDRHMVRPSVALPIDSSSALALSFRNSSPLLFWMCKGFLSLRSGRVWSAIFLAVLLVWMSWLMPSLVLHCTKVTLWKSWVFARASVRVLGSVGNCLAYAIKEEMYLAGMA
ncbi:MAG: hypothetical protein LQ346_006698 [Caloplaca aetnensis]|nr:MAG: hypothetical protein LQ346_006698 [Caloplaca aetnensis]